jgi:uncharacterized membrane protein YqjE
MLWLLPKAAPALLRHLAAYVELASLDLEVTRREFEAKIFASVLLGICALFLLLMICLLVVACTWDTPYRVTAIACMAGVFLVAALGALVHRSNVVRAKTQFLASVRQEWLQDRVLVERILSDED